MVLAVCDALSTFDGGKGLLKLFNKLSGFPIQMSTKAGRLLLSADH